jgi:viroplasmin and RNaseH domain-containing protein
MALTLQDDMENIFLNSGFEEDVLYTASGGDPKTIKAVVFRGSAISANLSSGRKSYRTNDIQVVISNNATYGIEVVTEREDVITVKERTTDTTAKSFTVKTILSSDNGAWNLLIG